MATEGEILGGAGVEERLAAAYAEERISDHDFFLKGAYLTVPSSNTK